MSLKAEQRKITGKVGRMLLKGFRDRLRKTKKNATGKTIRSLKIRTELTFARTTISVVADESLKFIIQGRKPGGKQPPPGSLIDWIKARKLKGRDKKGRFITHKSLEFLLGRKIARDGIKPTSIIEEAVSPIRSTLGSMIMNLGKKGIREEIFTAAKKAAA